jgi:hypothetical protein
MNKIFFALIIISGLFFVACDDENLPKANLNLMEVASIVATPGDMEVNIEWTLMENAKPTGIF